MTFSRTSKTQNHPFQCLGFRRGFDLTRVKRTPWFATTWCRLEVLDGVVTQEMKRDDGSWTGRRQRARCHGSQTGTGPMESAPERSQISPGSCGRDFKVQPKVQSGLRLFV